VIQPEWDSFIGQHLIHDRVGEVWAQSAPEQWLFPILGIQANETVEVPFAFQTVKNTQSR